MTLQETTRMQKMEPMSRGRTDLRKRKYLCFRFRIALIIASKANRQRMRAHTQFGPGMLRQAHSERPPQLGPRAPASWS